MEFFWFVIILICGVPYCSGQTCTESVNIQQAGDNQIDRNGIGLVPRLNFSCNGRITHIRVRIWPHRDNNGIHILPYIQVWRPSSVPITYNKIYQVQVQESQTSRPEPEGFLEANVPLIGTDRIFVQSGDVVGFYHPPNFDRQVRTIPTHGYVLYLFDGSNATMSLDFSTAMATDMRQPLIQFTIVTCPSFTDSNNGTITCSLGDDGVPSYGDTCSFTCNTGYELIGSDTRVCQSDGSWNGTETMCRRVSCPSLTDPSNGTMTCSLGDVGVPSYEDTCSFTCNTGYELTGSNTRTCQSDGSWNGTETMCRRVSCPSLTEPNNGTMTCSLGDDRVPSYEDTCDFTCNTGCELTGSDTRTCQSDGKWSGNETMCNQNKDTTVEFGSTEYTATEESGSIAIEIVRSFHLRGTTVTVEITPYEQSPPSAQGSGIDFNSNSVRVTFNPGEIRKLISIPVTCDRVVERVEVFNMRLSVVSVTLNIQIDLGLSSCVGVIIDSTVKIIFDPQVFAVSESVGSLSPGILLSQPSPVSFSLLINLFDVNATGTDYTQQNVSVPIARNSSGSFSFDINLNDDEIIECTEVFNVVISPTSWCGLVSGNTAQVTIINDDVGAVDLIFTGEHPRVVKESAGLFNIDFRVNATASHDLTFVVTMTNNFATAGSDYGQTEESSPLTSSVTIPSGELSVSLNVNIIDDTVQEENETFSLTVDLRPCCLPVAINGDHAFTITIIDDEELTVQFNNIEFVGTEESGSIIVTVDLLGGTASHDFNVSVTTSPVTAIAGVDYDATPLTATFKTGDTSVTVTIPVVNDRVVNEKDEEFSVTLTISSPTGVRVERGDVSTTRGIIQDTTRPQITTHPLNETVEINNDSVNIQFTCMAEGASAYFWQRGGGDDIPTDALGMQTNTLTLVTLIPPDEGQYRCVAVNQHGRNFSDYAMLRIKVHPPVVTISPLTASTDAGKQVKFSCSATGLSANTFVYGWLQNGRPIKKQRKQTLTVTTSENNAGNYECTVRNQYGNFGKSRVATLSLSQFCNPVTVNYTGFNVTWNETLVGVTVEVPCSGPGLNGTVQRRCKGEDEWVEFFQCFRVKFKELAEEASNITMSINELSEEEKISAVTNIASTLSNLTTASEEQEVYAEEIDLVVNIITTLNGVTETVVDMLKPDDMFFEKTTEVFDNILNNNNQQNWQQLQQTSPKTSQSLVNSTEQFGKLLGATLSNDTTEIIMTKKNIVIKAQLISNDSIQAGEDYVFPSENDDLSVFTGGSTQITFSNDVLKDVLNQLSPDTTGFPITNTILRDDVLQLPSPTNETETILPISPIISIQVPVPISTTENNPISLTFDVKSTSELFNSLPSSEKETTCQFYDHNLIDIELNQAGGWSQEGVKFDGDNSNNTRVTCLATHLTTFAVLVSINPGTTGGAAKALSIVSYIGCAVSLLCLCLSIILILYVIFRTKDKINRIFIHLNLCIALASGLIVFVAGIETATDYRASCVLVAVLLQYFFTSAFCWMLCEGVMLYMLLVTVFGNKLNNRHFFFFLGWGPAIPIVAISAGIANEHYGNDDYCWITSDDGAIAAFIIPIAVIILINFVFLGITLKVLYSSRRNRMNENDNTNTTKPLLKATLFLLPLLGVTWIIGILAVNNDTVVFAWIFAILNSLQGVFIFIFQVLRNKQVVREIREWYNFWRNSQIYSIYSRMRSGRRSTSTMGSSIGTSSMGRERTSQSNFDLHGKKISLGSSTSGADYLNTTPSKEVSETPVEDCVFDEEKSVKLTTFNRLKESIIEEQDVGCEKESFFEQNSEVKEALPEKHETKASSSKEKGFDKMVSIFEVQHVESQGKQSGTATKFKPDVLPHTNK